MNDNVDDQFQVLMERHLKLQRSPNGPLTDVVIQLGYPRWTELNVEAACPVAIRGDIGRVSDIRGIDPINAVKQAIAFVEKYLDRSATDEKVFWPDGEEYSGG